MPVTTPPATLALEFDALHIPPEAAFVSESVLPTHTLAEPEIVPGLDNGLTVITLVAEAVPQELDTV